MSAFRMLRHFGRAVLHLPDRFAHHKRRVRAQAQLARTAPPASILFVCHGNLYRSPYAAAAMRHLLRFSARPVRVTSAGFRGPDRPTPPDGVAEAAERDVDLATHRSQLVNHALIDDAAWILVMNAWQRDAIVTLRPRARSRVVILGDLDPERVAAREILDPRNGIREDVVMSFDRIDRCLAEVSRLAWRP